MFRFARPDYLYLLLLVPVLLVFFYYSLIVKAKRLKQLGNKELLRELMPDASHWRPRVKFYIGLTAYVLGVFVVAGPQSGSKLETVKRKGVELMIAVDVSNSMYATDVAPNRMDRSKQILSRMIDQLDGNKVGLLVFAGEPFVQMPMTNDVASAKMFLSMIDPGMVPVQGTAIGSAIRMSLGLFSDNESVGKSVIVITDGENHEDDAVAMARLAHENGITVHVLGVGRPEGSPLPVPGTNTYRKDREGNTVVSKLNEAMCKEIASAGGGTYVRADNLTVAIRALSAELDRMSKVESETEVYSEYMEQYPSIAWLMLVLLVVDVCLLERKNPRLKNVKLF
ncbi:MAG: VWA domain-containing protein [Paludibacteraceae bacterium]|nr:VWA domain-containing protein [Paludibacteraceae bacterium]